MPAGQEQVASLEALDTFAGSTKPITPPRLGRKVMVTKLEEVDRRGGKVLSVMSGLPLVVRGPCGFGRVTLIAVDVDQKLFSEWPDRALFWARALDLRPQRAEQAATGVPIGGAGRFNRWAITDLAGQLRAALEQFPGVRLIPFGWVAFFIFLYILLIGPGDYFFLKKVLKRMELTWITFPTIVVTVSLLAYYAAYLVQGERAAGQPGGRRGHRPGRRPGARARPGPGCSARRTATTRCGSSPCRSTASRRRPTRAPAASRPAGGGDRGHDELVQLARGPVRRHGEHQPPIQLRQRRLRLRGYADQGGTDPAAAPSRASRGSASRSGAPSASPRAGSARPAPLVDSDLVPVGTDRLAGTVTNRLDVPLEDAIVAFGKQVYLLGTIGPRATIRVELTPATATSRATSRTEQKANGIAIDQRIPDSRIDRSDLMLDVMFHDSESHVGNDRIRSPTTRCTTST